MNAKLRSVARAIIPQPMRGFVRTCLGSGQELARQIRQARQRRQWQSALMKFVAAPTPYMRSAIPVTADFESEEISAFAKSIGHTVALHRKFWEWAFIAHHLERAGVLAPERRGLAFGVGSEPLPALFASRGCEIVATDGPSNVVTPGWQATGQYAADKEQLYHGHIIDRGTFDRLVSFETCDMNAIPAHLRNFDFCWSACSLEHLGNLEAGMEFVVNSIKCLKPGGVAVHTTEFNLSSPTNTLTEGPTCIYRKRDVEALKARLTTAGHDVLPLPIVIGPTPMDTHFDLPPFKHDPHLKLRLSDYICTSYGLVVRKTLD